MGSVLSATGLIGALALGSWWTAMAVVDGDVGNTLARFLVSTALGLYYLMLTRASRTNRA